MRNERADVRREVLRLLQAAAQPSEVVPLAERLHVHPNTIRFHLDALEREGRVERVRSAAVGRGRPRVLYRARPGAGNGDRRYELLASILIDSLGTGSQAIESATRAGIAWGRRHADDPEPGDRDSAAEGFVNYLDEAGFAPQRVEAGVVELHNCPFREVVEERGAIICAVHAGMVQGAAPRWGIEPAETELQPLVRPGVCRMRFETGAAA